MTYVKNYLTFYNIPYSTTPKNHVSTYIDQGMDIDLIINFDSSNTDLSYLKSEAYRYNVLYLPKEIGVVCWCLKESSPR